MRIEEVVSKDYSRQSMNRRHAPKAKKLVRPLRAFTFCDTVELDDTATALDTSIEWLCAYVRMIPQELAVEKTNQFFAMQPKDDILVDKLLLTAL